MNLVKIISTEIDDLTQRVSKFLRFGLNDVQTAIQTAPYGMDSNPIKGMIAVYGATSEKGKPVIIGYINKNQLADIGEARIFSTDENGVLKTFIWLKNDGIIEIGGDVDNMVRFSELKTAFNEMQSDVNTLKTAISGWTPIPNDGGAALKVALATWFAATLVENIDDSRIDQIKTL
ncbi:hypothetical protein LCGC14_0579510 [marine sediment metagenome]|uniref:Uncharacterized protein n=1 Tax=marine sediment metagenome TaxID=412755 RepID=A0A0F9U341_9ZZZZ